MFFATNVVPQITLGRLLEGLDYALVGLLQALLIPATGGAERSDIVVNAGQIGESVLGVLGFVVLAWTGAFAEEVFFRGDGRLPPDDH